MIYMEQERVFVGIIHGLVTVGLICYICKQTMCIFFISLDNVLILNHSITSPVCYQHHLQFTDTANGNCNVFLTSYMYVMSKETK